MAQIAMLEGTDLGLYTKGPRSMSRSRLSALPPPLEFSEGFGFLGDLVTKDIAISSGMSLIGGAALGLASDLGLPKLTFMQKDGKMVAWRYAAANLLVGAVAGRAIWNLGPRGMGNDAAKGLMGAAGANVARAIVAMVKGGFKASLDGLAISYDDDIDLASLSADPEDILLSDVGVEQRQLLSEGTDGLEDTDVQERRPGQIAGIESWLS